MIKVGVLYGGRSGEHEVSKCSAASVIKSLDKAKFEIVAIGIDHDGRWYVQSKPEFEEDSSFGSVMKLNKNGNWFVNHYENDGKLCLFDVETGAQIKVDIVFPVIHGTFCEDGTVQGLLELAMVPYIGADVIGSAIGMDKDVSKRLLRDAGIPVVDWVCIFRSRWDTEKEIIVSEIIKNIGFPCFIKPANAGSSVGISKVKDLKQLEVSMEEAFCWDNKILVEKAVNVREIEFSVLGNEEPDASIPGEIRPKHEFYSYEAKYIDADGAELIIPADINSDLTSKMKKAAIDGYKALCCQCLARVDFFLDKESGEFFLNEINTLPGFTNISMYPKLWAESGIQYKDLLEKLIMLAFDRRKNRNRLRTGF